MARLSNAMYGKNPTKEERDEFRALLREKPKVANILGMLPGMVCGESLKRFATFHTPEESFQLKKLRADLADEHPSELEQLQVEAVVLCYQNYFSFALLMNTHTNKESTLNAIEQWERVLNSKEQSYLCAIGELARVRRLLNLPAPQVNINLPGGQQLNIAGDVSTGGKNGAL